MIETALGASYLLCSLGVASAGAASFILARGLCSILEAGAEYVVTLVDHYNYTRKIADDLNKQEKDQDKAAFYSQAGETKLEGEEGATDDDIFAGKFPVETAYGSTTRLL